MLVFKKTPELRTVDDIEEALTELRSARELLNAQLMATRGLGPSLGTAPPEQLDCLKTAYVVRVTDTVRVLCRVNQAIDVLEQGAADALAQALMCLKREGSEHDLQPASSTLH